MDFRKTRNNLQRESGITDFPSLNKYDMKKHLKSGKPALRGPHTKGEIAAKSIEDKIILREQILDGLKVLDPQDGR